MSVPLEWEFFVKWMGQTAEGVLQLLPSTSNLRLQVWQGSQVPKFRWDECDHSCGMSIHSAATSPNGELGMDQQLFPPLESAGAKVFRQMGKACQCCSTQHRICLDFQFEFKASLETGLMMGWLVRCPWCLSLIHQQWIGLMSSCLNSCPPLVPTGHLGSFISLTSLLMLFQFLWKSEGLAGTSL